MSETLPAILLFAALVGFYISFRAVRSAEWGLGGSVNGWTSIACALPLAGVVAVASAMGRPEMALGAALSGAVASIGLVGGMVLMQRRPGSVPTEGIGTWPLLTPVALSILLVGLAGAITPMAVGALLLLGVFLLPTVRVPAVEAAHSSEASTGETQPPVGRMQRGTFVGLGVVVALLAGWAAIEGASQLSLRNAHAPAGLLAACVLGPAAIMPFLGLAIARASDGHTYHALGLCVRLSIVCVLGLVPIAAAVHFGRNIILESGGWVMPFAASLWRVETVLLLAFAVLLVPVSTGRFVPTRRDGVLLLLLYVVYLVMSAIGGARLL
jgi:cation:H+ antiporter